jgi:hypothetical protein
MYRAYAWRRGRSGRSSEDQTSTHCQHASWLNHLWLKVYTSTHLLQFLISWPAEHSDLRGRSGPISYGNSWYFSTIRGSGVRHEWRIPRAESHLPAMRRSVVTSIARIVSSLVCAVCTSVWCVLVSSYWFGFYQISWFRNMSHAIRWCNPSCNPSLVMGFIAQERGWTWVRWCHYSEICGVIGGLRGKWILWNARQSGMYDFPNSINRRCQAVGDHLHSVLDHRRLQMSIVCANVLFSKNSN